MGRRRTSRSWRVERAKEQRDALREDEGGRGKKDGWEDLLLSKGK